MGKWRDGGLETFLAKLAAHGFNRGFKQPNNRKTILMVSLHDKPLKRLIQHLAL